jgi:site-specific recombinase XerD
MNIDTYISHLEQRNWSPQTLRAYESDLKLFHRYIKSRQLRIDRVDERVIDEYIATMKTAPNNRHNKVGMSETTIRRRVAALRGYFCFAQRMNPKQRNPTEAFSFRRFTKKVAKSQALEDTALTTLLAGVTSLRDRAMFSLFVSSGLRLSELHQLNRDTIGIRQESPNSQKKIIGFGRVIGKGSKERTFYFDAETADTLAAYLRTRTDSNPGLFVSGGGDRLARRSIQERLSHWCKVLNLDRVHVHQLRHTFATRLANADISSMALKELMGHSSFNTTLIYFRLKDQTIARQYFAAMEYLKN